MEIHLRDGTSRKSQGETELYWLDRSSEGRDKLTRSFTHCLPNTGLCVKDSEFSDPEICASAMGHFSHTRLTTELFMLQGHLVVKAR